MHNRERGKKYMLVIQNAKCETEVERSFSLDLQKNKKNNDFIS